MNTSTIPLKEQVPVPSLAEQVANLTRLVLHLQERIGILKDLSQPPYYWNQLVTFPQTSTPAS